jgi:hypothetical protein
LIGCATSGGASAPPADSAAFAAELNAPVQSAPQLKGVPDFVNKAFLNASEDVLIGIGIYRIGKDMTKMSIAKTGAEVRARADIIRQLESIMKDMINDYTATSELDEGASISFTENVTQSLAKSNLKGSKTIEMNTDENGLLYVVMEYSKSLAANDYSAATAAAKLAVPAAAAFDAVSRMDTAFSKNAAGGPIPVGD